jgi:methyltransferase (TIGR00027 family)
MLVRNVSDTARWVAFYRAQETERPDALFRDPFARRLAGERGEQIAKAIPLGGAMSWNMVTRTVLIDDLVRDEIAGGVDTVVNLAAGLDTRPYRMELPASLQWIEVDLPGILDYKEAILAGEKPVCSLERIRLDLSKTQARRQLFADLGGRSDNALVITEGLLVYLDSEDVAELARDLAAPASFRSWILDVISPASLTMLRKPLHRELSQTAPFKFAPPEGPDFFVPYGWTPVAVHSLLKNAARLKRLSLMFRFFALFPETPTSRRDRPWTGICLFRKR